MIGKRILAPRQSSKIVSSLKWRELCLRSNGYVNKNKKRRWRDRNMFLTKSATLSFSVIMMLKRF